MNTLICKLSKYSVMQKWNKLLHILQYEYVASLDPCRVLHNMYVYVGTSL